MKVIQSITLKIGIIGAIITIAGLYLVAATIGSICLGVPMGWITAGVIVMALLWEAGEYLLPWVQLRWLRYKRNNKLSKLR